MKPAKKTTPNEEEIRDLCEQSEHVVAEFMQEYERLHVERVEKKRGRRG